MFNLEFQSRCFSIHSLIWVLLGESPNARHYPRARASAQDKKPLCRGSGACRCQIACCPINYCSRNIAAGARYSLSHSTYGTSVAPMTYFTTCHLPPRLCSSATIPSSNIPSSMAF